MDDLFEKRIGELFSRASDRGIFVFTPFLSPSEQAETVRICGKKNVCFFGGADFAERKIARFGDPEELGYEEFPPVALLKVVCTAGKFASPLTHRDYLGAVLRLGIEREAVGDIFVDGGTSYLVTTEKPAETVLRELARVGRERVEVFRAEEIPSDLRPKTEEREIVVSSFRADAVVCAVWNLPRSEGQKLTEKEALSADGKILLSGAKELKAGTVVTARGHGKFIVGEAVGKTKKGNYVLKVSVFV